MVKETDVRIDKLPPQNIEAEQSVLGAVLFDNEALTKALETLSADDFYKETHRRLFKAMLDLFEKNEPIDLITLNDHLKKLGDLEAVGGVAYLSLLANSVPTSANIRYHAKIVREKALLRALIQTATQITAKVYEDSFDADEMVDQAEHMIFEIAEKRTKTSFASMDSVIKDSIRMIEHLYDKKEAITGVPSGFKDLDEMTSGFQPSDLIIIGGRPGMGKTAFALNIAQHVGVELKEPVAIFSLEMSKEQLAMRMLCSEGMVDASRVRKGFLSREDWPKLTSAAGRLAESPLFIDDSSAISVLEVRAKARRLKKEHRGLSLVVVDYLQLMRSRGNFERREQEISEISRSLKALAKELRVPVIALSQLNRAVEQRSERKPTLADLRECVTGDTLVVLADGRRLPIRDLVGTTPEVVSVSPEGKLVYAKSDLVWSVGQRPVVTLRLASGRKLRCTGRHRLWGADGWARVETLAVGDRVAIVLEEHVRSVMAERGISHRAMATARETSYGGSSHFRFAPSRAVVADYAEILDDDSLRREAANDLFWDRIVEIEPNGTEEVFDLTVPGPSSWLADGIISHNSGAIEQDADVIIFLYRDEVYNKASQKKGIAEVIIAKQRNGPTGMINLQFQSAMTRFSNLSGIAYEAEEEVF